MTMQSRELLIYEGQPRRLLALPLASCDRPIPAFDGFSTACYRGYHGTWEFRDDTFHLVGLESPTRFDRRNRLCEMFPESAGSVEAVWFSGIVADDATGPEDIALIERRTELEIPINFMAVIAVVRLGKLLLETATDLKTGVVRSRLTRYAEELFPGEEFAFLRAIQAEPNDITAKLVFADWLEDQDDPRGSVLREETIRQEREGPRQARIESGTRWNLPPGCVPAENVMWFWRRLAGIPEPTPEELWFQGIRRRTDTNQ
jgi:uncharacterized protein (TIGR02996 family)